MTGSGFAHSELAQRRRLAKARTLARWCYDRGIGPGVGDQPPPVLRALAHRAGVNPPHVDPTGASPTWRLVTDLLTARDRWDRAHHRQPPPPVRCIACTVLQERCADCWRPPTPPPVCASCGQVLDPGLRAAGIEAHPACPPPLVAAEQPELFAAVPAPADGTFAGGMPPAHPRAEGASFDG